MKKLITLVASLAFLLVAMPAMAAKPGNPGKAPEKVDVCHVIEANDVIPFSFSGPPTVMLHFGKVISVSENAVDVHVEHGDSTTFFSGDTAAGPIAAFREAGAKLPAANCYLVKPIVN